MPEVVITPWTPEQVATLNANQSSGFMHPYTCGTKEKHEPGADSMLVATATGWKCSSCDYTQAWAHDFSAESVHPNPFAGIFENPDEPHH